MTSPNRRPSLEDVLDGLFLRDDAPTAEEIVQACQAHAEFREEILEFASLWVAQDALPEPTASDLEVSEASVMRLQSRVLNALHAAARPAESADVVRAAIATMAGNRLKFAARATGLNSTTLVTKILTKTVIDPPAGVLVRLAEFLNVGMASLSELLGPELAGQKSYKSADRPMAGRRETWDQAINSLAVDEAEKSRLLAMQDRSCHS